MLNLRLHVYICFVSKINTFCVGKYRNNDYYSCYFTKRHFSLQTIYFVILLSFDVLTGKLCNSVKL